MRDRFDAAVSHRDLMPIHDRCECTVSPLYGKKDPGQVINRDRLDAAQGQLKEQGVEYTAGGFKTDRSLRIQQHGEHGPTLTWGDQGFTGPSDL